MGQSRVAMGWDNHELPWDGTVTSCHEVGRSQVVMDGAVTSCHGMGQSQVAMVETVTSCHGMGQSRVAKGWDSHELPWRGTVTSRVGFTYRLYKLKPRASRSNGASNILW